MASSILPSVTAAFTTAGSAIDPPAAGGSLSIGGIGLSRYLAEASAKEEIESDLRHIIPLNRLLQCLLTKYPALRACPSQFEDIQNHFLAVPDPIAPAAVIEHAYFTAVIGDLLKEDYSSNDVRIVFSHLARQLSQFSRSELRADVDLRALRSKAKADFEKGLLVLAPERVFKDIYTTELKTGDRDKKAKVKFGPKSTAIHELVAFQIDQVFGFEMTAPSKIEIPVNSNDLLKGIVVKLKSESTPDIEEALALLDRLPVPTVNALHGAAYKLYGQGKIGRSIGREIWESDLPLSMRISILNEYLKDNRKVCLLREGLLSRNTADIEGAIAGMASLPTSLQNQFHAFAYRLFGENRSGIDGKKIWESDLPILDRVAILDAYLEEKNALSVQLWITAPSKRAYDIMLDDPEAGRKLKEIPKSIVHLNCLLAMIKGSRDCSSGNTMLLFNDDGSIGGMSDFDDEHSFPISNNYNLMRCWQLGLPQADLPFDRAVLLLFKNTSLRKSVENFIARAPLNPLAKSALEERCKQIFTLFDFELEKDTIELTPRELFFRIFGGREEYAFLQTETKEGITPWEIFEYALGARARSSSPSWQAYFDGVGADLQIGAEWAEKISVKSNLACLY